jgi:hypothetical protein
MVSVTLTQVNSVVSNGFQTVSTASAASIIPVQIFTFDYQTNKFSHTATLFDILNYPTSPTPGQAYYRLAAVTQIFANIQDAENNITAMQQRVASLVTLYSSYESSFPGTEINTYTG